jgi:hypothetical protein
MYSCGRYTKAEWWVKDIYEYKNFLNNAIKSPRIIIAGGSNSLFGINSDVTSTITGYNVFNISSHAALDISFHYLKIKEYMNDGDIVVIPLEYEYYYNKNPYTEWFIDNMMAWGKEDYIEKLDIFNFSQFIFHVPKTKIFNLLTSKKEPPLNNKSIVILSILNSLHRGWNGYSYRSINKNGEINIDTKPDIPTIKLKEKGIRYINNIEVSSHFISYFKKISELVKERHGKIILTWPVSIRNHYFDLSNKNHQNLATQLAENLKKEAIILSCDPEMFNMDIQYFFNSAYHLNKNGAQIRSERLGQCINDVLHP